MCGFEEVKFQGERKARDPIKPLESLNITHQTCGLPFRAVLILGMAVKDISQVFLLVGKDSRAQETGEHQ
jgi:hypothetical protein